MVANGLVQIRRESWGYNVIPKKYTDIGALADDFNGATVEEIRTYIKFISFEEVYYTDAQTKMVSVFSYISGIYLLWNCEKHVS